MSISYDPIAFLVALFAIWFAYHESKRNNAVVIKIQKLSFSGQAAIDENCGRYFTRLTVIIRNQGIALHNPSLCISFREKAGFGWLNYPLKLRRESFGESGEFSRGMLAEYIINSYELKDDDKKFLRNLIDPAEQDASLDLYSQGYLAKSFRIGGLWDRSLMRWSNFAHRFNDLFTLRYYDNDSKSEVVKRRTPLPYVKPMFVETMMFVQSLAAREDIPGFRTGGGGEITPPAERP